MSTRSMADDGVLRDTLAQSKNLIVGTWQWGGEFFRRRHFYPKGTCVTCGRLVPDLIDDVCNLRHGSVNLRDKYRRGILEEKDCKAIFMAAVQNGVTCFDTAADYGAGRSESLLGRVIAEARSKNEVFPATLTPKSSAGMMQLLGDTPFSAKATVFSKVSLNSRVSAQLHSDKMLKKVSMKHASIHRSLWTNALKEWGPNLLGAFVSRDGFSCIRRCSGSFEASIAAGLGLSFMHADERVIARQMLSSDHRLYGALESVCLHIFEEAQTFAERRCWWTWLKAMRDDFGIFKNYGACAKTPEHCHQAASWPILDYISVPFNVVNANEFVPVLTKLRKDRPKVAILARETLASGFLTGCYESRQAWLQARRPKGCRDLPINEFKMIYDAFDKWWPAAKRFQECARAHNLTLGSAGAMYALGSGLFDGVALGFSTLGQARETLDAWDAQRSAATAFFKAVG